MLLKILLLSLIIAATNLFGMSLGELNGASKKELMEIKGIGEKKATAIIKERSTKKFTSYEDLQRVPGIGKQIAQNVKNDVKRATKSGKKTAKTKDTKKSLSTKSQKSTKVK